MIKFFRKIRKKLLKENKTSKYFKYAIGEIILVVIGILIALQINNWNENRLEKIKSKEFHERIVEDLDLKIKNMHEEIKRSKKVKTYLVSSLKILKNDVFKKEQKDTLDYALRNYYQFVLIDGALKSIEEMKSSGQLGLIYNKEIKKEIDKYLNFLSSVSKIYEQIADNVSNDEVVVKHIFIEVGERINKSKFFYDFNALKKDQVFINRLSKISVSWQTKKEFSNVLLKWSKELKDKVELELSKND